MTAYGKIQEVAAPLVEKLGESERGQTAKTYVDDVQTKPEFQAVVKVATWVFTENTPPPPPPIISVSNSTANLLWSVTDINSQLLLKI